jgi:hypothetical protein
VVIAQPARDSEASRQETRVKPMLQLHQLAKELHRERLAQAAQQRPAQRLLTHRTKARRAEQRLRNAVRKALRLRTAPQR